MLTSSSGNSSEGHQYPNCQTNTILAVFILLKLDATWDAMGHFFLLVTLPDFRDAEISSSIQLLHTCFLNQSFPHSGSQNVGHPA